MSSRSILQQKHDTAMLNLIISLIGLFIALIVQVCEWLFNAGKYVVFNIFPVLWDWFVRLIPWAGIPIALLALWRLRDRFLGRVIVYLGLSGIWWLTVDDPPWRYLLVGILLWECFCLIITTVMHLRTHTLRMRLSKTGILSPYDTKDVPEKILTWIKQKKLAEVDSSGNLCSTKFLNTLCRQLDLAGAMTQVEFLAESQKAAPAFQEDRFQILLKFLVQSSGAILLPGSPSYCIGPGAIQECKALLYMEGAATKKEFSALCAQSSLLARFSIPTEYLAASILKSMSDEGEVKQVSLAETSETLYVIKNPPVQTKLTQVEISLDD